MLKALLLLALVLYTSAIPHELIPERFAEASVEADPQTPPPPPASPAPTAAEYGAPVPATPAPTGPVLKPAIIAHQEVNVLKIPAIPVRVEEVQAPTQDEWVMENEQNDPEIRRINLAMEAVKEDMVGTSHQLAKEIKWIADVKKIMADYKEKVTRVQAHVHELREQMKVLYHKRVQIKNLRLQHMLEEKLREAQDELSALMGSINNVKRKKYDLRKSREEIQATVNAIQSQLEELKSTQKADQAAAAEAEAEEPLAPPEPVAPISPVPVSVPVTGVAEVLVPAPMVVDDKDDTA